MEIFKGDNVTQRDKRSDDGFQVWRGMQKDSKVLPEEEVRNGEISNVRIF